jgi:hypothetical protein
MCKLTVQFRSIRQSRVTPIFFIAAIIFSQFVGFLLDFNCILCRIDGNCTVFEGPRRRGLSLCWSRVFSVNASLRSQTSVFALRTSSNEGESPKTKFQTSGTRHSCQLAAAAKLLMDWPDHCIGSWQLPIC